MTAPPDNLHIQKLFDTIAVGYDRFNRLCSLGQDVAWRTQTVKSLEEGIKVLDIGCGTGDLTYAAAHKIGSKGHVVGLDFSQQMINYAQQRVAQNDSASITWLCESAVNLPIPDHQFDFVVSGFVLRNLYNDIGKILQGTFKSLVNGGKIAFIDLTEPENACLRLGSRLYMQAVVSLWGYYCFKSTEPVTYLRNSMKRFFRAKEFSELLRQTGFVNVQTQSFCFGAVTLYTGEKPR